MKNIHETISQLLDQIEIFDFHTHLFPPEHKNYFLTGIDELLNYHYLIAELFITCNVKAKIFNTLSKLKKQKLFGMSCLLKEPQFLKHVEEF